MHPQLGWGARLTSTQSITFIAIKKSARTEDQLRMAVSIAFEDHAMPDH